MSKFLLISEPVKTLIGEQVVDVVFKHLDIVVTTAAIIEPLGFMDMLYERGTAFSLEDLKENIYSSFGVEAVNYSDEVLYELWEDIKKIFEKTGEMETKC